jgi:hypothetical protein
VHISNWSFEFSTGDSKMLSTVVSIDGTARMKLFILAEKRSPGWGMKIFKIQLVGTMSLHSIPNLNKIMHDAFSSLEREVLSFLPC